MGNRKFNCCCLSWMVVAVVVGCAPQGAVVRPPTYWPTEGWRTSTPEQQGVDSERLAKAFDFIKEQDLNIHSLLVIRNGYIVADAYFHPFARGSRHDVASVTKSFTSTLVGIAVHKGHINSVKQPVLDFFPERTVANVDANKKAMTLENLLTMTSGLECINQPSELTLFQMIASPDWVQFMLDLPMSDEPGTRFVYNSGGSHLLSAIIREAAGKNALAFGREHLFGPLGISDVIWPFDPQGANNHGWGDLKLTPHDMAKLGYLYLHRGLWEGRQVLSPEWVEAATSKHVSTTWPAHNGYGYLWWIRSSVGYSAVGRGCQRISVVPDKDIVVVVTAGAGGSDEGEIEKLLPSLIIPAARSKTPLSANPDGLALLESKVRQAALSEARPKPVPPLPEMAHTVSGQTYVLDTNMFGLKALSLTFQEQEQALFRVSTAEDNQTIELPVGLDNVFRIAPGRFGLSAALKGSWETDSIFVLDFDEIGNINHWRIRVTFEGDKVALQMQEATGLGDLTINGRIKK